jgi:hypothetical protein
MALHLNTKGRLPLFYLFKRLPSSLNAHALDGVGTRLTQDQLIRQVL